AEKAGAKAALTKARAVEAALTNALSKQFRHGTAAEVEMLLGDAKKALATARRAERGRPRFDALYAVGLAQKKADRAGAAKTLAEAAREIVGEEKEGGWSPPFRVVMKELTEAGGHKEALALLDKENSPRVRALGLVGVVEGLALAKKEAKKP